MEPLWPGWAGSSCWLALRIPGMACVLQGGRPHPDHPLARGTQSCSTALTAGPSCCGRSVTVSWGGWHSRRVPLGGAGPPQRRRGRLAAPHPSHSVPWQLFVQHLLVPSTGARGQSEPQAACLSSGGFSGWKVSLCVNEASKVGGGQMGSIWLCLFSSNWNELRGSKCLWFN